MKLILKVARNYQYNINIQMFYIIRLLDVTWFEIHYSLANFCITFYLLTIHLLFKVYPKNLNKQIFILILLCYKYNLMKNELTHIIVEYKYTRVCTRRAHVCWSGWFNEINFNRFIAHASSSFCTSSPKCNLGNFFFLPVHFP